MNKKLTVMVSTVLMALAIPFSVFAATSDTAVAKNVRGFFGKDYTQLTDTQKKDIDTYAGKMADLQKSFIDQMVKNGAITKEEADERKLKINEMIKNGHANGLLPGMGFGRGKMGAHGKFERKPLDLSKLTDAQKKDLSATYVQYLDLQKSQIPKMVDVHLLDQTQADQISSKIESLRKALLENGLGSETIGLTGDMRGIGLGRILFGGAKDGEANFTDEQKAVLTDYMNQSNTARKEMIKQLASFGIMSQDQADKAISKMDELTKLIIDSGFSGKNLQKQMPERKPGRHMKGMPGRKGLKPDTTDKTRDSANPAQ